MTEQIKKLSDYQHVRLRTAVYYGSTSKHLQSIVGYDHNYKPILKEFEWIPALYTCFREIIDNSLDEMVGYGYGNKLYVNYDESSKIMEVEDNGRGIPIDFDNENNCHIATLVLSELKAGRNFNERKQVIGQNGMGGSGTNFCSEFFKLEIKRDNKLFIQEFTEGNELFGDQLIIKDPEIKPLKSSITGTKITFKLSLNVFSNYILPLDFVKDRIIEIAYCNPNIKVYFNNELIKIKNKLFDNSIEFNIDEEDFKSVFNIIPNWMDSENDINHCIINNITSFNGATYIDTFNKLFYTNLLNSLEKESKKRKLQPNKSDITGGILLYNVSTMDSPDFDSQSKTRLINESVDNIIKSYLNNDELYKSIIKKNKEWIDQIYKKCSERTSKKSEIELKKAVKKASKLKVKKLTDASSNDRTKCTLILCEGDSAVSGVLDERDPEYIGALPLRGKVMNVTGKNMNDIINNEVLRDIMNSIGLQINKSAIINELRYSKIYLAHDADPDGYNIGALLINFFYTFWPELFKEEYFYIFRTPFLIASKGKNKKYWYSYNYNEFNGTIYNKQNGWSIIRAKGLAALSSSDWNHCLNKPDLFPITEDDSLKNVLSLLFDPTKTDDRKNFIGL